MPREVVYKPNEKLNPIYSGGTLTPPKFMPTYYEWLSTKGEFIFRESDQTGRGQSLYEVPENKTLFITTMWLSCCNIGTERNLVGTLYDELGQMNASDYLKVRAFIVGGTQNISVTYPIPLKLTSKHYIKLGNIYSSFNVFGGFVGFLVKNRDIPSF